MNKSDVEKIKSLKFNNFLQEMLFEKDISKKEICGLTGISYSTILKIKSRNPSLINYLLIMYATNSSVDEYIEDLLGKPSKHRKIRRILDDFSSDELIIIQSILNLSNKKRNLLFKSLCSMIEGMESE
ncbi:MAG: hypothetical protein HFF02_08985 [Erysipelotrichaceae bacterium]|nr:hypothetical protein [Erysipelotrichaceae bacterium]